MKAELLAEAAGIPLKTASMWSGPITDVTAYAWLRTPQRMAAFLAQIGHESGGFRYVREIWGPTHAQKRYEGRRDLGNSLTGDGYRYRGRGLIQITGRANYLRITERLTALGAPDFLAEPHRLEEPKWAALSAADYWLDLGLNELADAGDFRAITKRINGGLGGYADRLARYERAARTLGA